MTYNLHKLNPHDFENLIQSLCRVLIGNGTISFGQGPDGGREATYEGIAPYPSTTNSWSGYWVIQAKYKIIDSEKGATDFTWLKNQIQAEFKKYKDRNVEVRKPDNYLFFTNIRLTAVAKTGSRDKANILERDLEKEYGVSNIKIISNDDISDFLNLNRQIATRYVSFILPDDIIFQLYKTLIGDELKAAARINNALSRFLEIEFKDNTQSKLDHAGKLTSDKVNLDKVFIDLSIKQFGFRPLEDVSSKFIRRILDAGNKSLYAKNTESNKFALVAGPGYGKSTLSQLLGQIYRSNFLKSINNRSPAISQFDEEIISEIGAFPKCVRFPITIILKKYAEWVKDRKSIQSSSTVIDYIISRINARNSEGAGLVLNDFEHLLKSISFLFVFDGLDEVPITSNRKDVLDEIISFTEIDLLRYETDALIVATTRPQGYTKEFNPDQYIHLQIDDLKPKECIRYIEKLVNNLEGDDDRKKNDLKILQEAIDHPIVSRLMKTPLQASIMTILVKSGGEPPRNKYDLFLDYYNVILKREKQKDVAKILKEHDMYVKDIHDRVGYHLQVISENSRNPAAAITLDAFGRIIEGYLEENGLNPEDKARISNEIQKASMDRLVFISEIEEGRIGFAIRSVQEYFAANYYFHNQPDQVIPDKLRAISKSYYWSNTLLFGLGYLTKNKKYTLDGFESICRELNGSAELSLISSPETLSMTGTWLAVDVINEGIFRAIPRIENKFANLVSSSVFSIIYQDKHRDLLKLPSNIRKVSILNQIETLLDKKFDLGCRTIWEVLSDFITEMDANAIKIFLENWPKDLTQQELLCGLIIKKSLFSYSQKIESKLIHCVLELNSYKLFNELLKTKNGNLISKISKVEMSKDFENNLFDFLFFEWLHDQSEHIFNLLNDLVSIKEKKLGDNTEKDRSRYVQDVFHTFKCKVSKSLSINTHSCLLKPILLWNRIENYCQGNENKLVLCFLKVCQRPTYVNIDSFIKEFKNISDEDKRGHVRKSLVFRSWLFHRLFILNDTLELPFGDLSKGEVNEFIVANERKLKSQITVDKLDSASVQYYYTWTSSFPLTLDELTVIKDVAESELEKGNAGKAMEFLIVFVCDFLSERQVIPLDWKPVIEFLFAKYTDSKSEYRFYQILLLQFCYNISENIQALFHDEHNIYLNSNSFAADNANLRVIERQGLPTVIKYVEEGFVSHRNVNFIKVLANILSNAARERKSYDVSHVQYNLYKSMMPDSDILKISLAIILLTNDGIDFKDVNVIKGYLKGVTDINEDWIVRIIDVISIYNSSNELLEPLFPEFDKLIDTSNYYLRGRFELLLRNFIGATKSNLTALV